MGVDRLASTNSAPFETGRVNSSLRTSATDSSRFQTRSVLYFGKCARDFVYPAYVKKGGVCLDHIKLAPIQDRRRNFHRLVLAKKSLRLSAPIQSTKTVTARIRIGVSKAWLRTTLTWRIPAIRLFFLQKSLEDGRAFEKAFSFARPSAYANIKIAADDFADNNVLVCSRILAKISDKSEPKIISDNKRASLKKEVQDRLERSEVGYEGRDSEFSVFLEKVNECLANTVKEFGDRVETCSHSQVFRLKKELHVLMNTIASEVSKAAEGDTFVDVDKIIIDCTLAWKKKSRVFPYDREKDDTACRPQRNTKEQAGELSVSPAHLTISFGDVSISAKL